MNVGPIGQMDSYSYNYKGYSSNVIVSERHCATRTIKSILAIKLISGEYDCRNSRKAIFERIQRLVQN